MATIYLPDDHGDAIIVDGVAYHKVGLVVHNVTHTPTAEDTLNIEEFDLSFIGEERTYGSVGNKVWTPCQHAVSMFPANYTEKECVVPAGTEAGTVVGTIYTAPSNGVLHMLPFLPYLYLNGVSILAGQAGPYLIRMLGGDVLQFGQHTSLTTERTGTATAKFRPDVYPA